jgi:hypothetical protein
VNVSNALTSIFVHEIQPIKITLSTSKRSIFSFSLTYSLFLEKENEEAGCWTNVASARIAASVRSPTATDDAVSSSEPALRKSSAEFH